MTERQKAEIARVRPWLSQVYQQAVAMLNDSPVGHMASIFVPRKCEVRVGQGYNPQYRQAMTDRVDVLKMPDGYKFRIAAPLYRKGWTAPKWRRLEA